MEPNPEDFPPSPFSKEEETEMQRVLSTDWEARERDWNQKEIQLRHQIMGLREEIGSLKRRSIQLNSEIESLRGQLQDLNLLDGFLRSGAVKALNLESDPTLKVLLTSFLARALQAALDTGATQFLPPRKKLSE